MFHVKRFGVCYASEISECVDENMHLHGSLYAVTVRSYTRGMNLRTQMQRTGRLGEDLASRYLVKHDYTIIEKNFLKKFGEIDIVCRKDGTIYFVEVKTVSRETLSREDADTHRPEDNVHRAKLKRMANTIAAYMEEKNIAEDFEIMVVLVIVSHKEKVARIKLLKNVIID